MCPTFIHGFFLFLRTLQVIFVQIICEKKTELQTLLESSCDVCFQCYASICQLLIRLFKKQWAICFYLIFMVIIDSKTNFSLRKDIE